jgi:FkbM family methyltransferase
MAMKYSRNERRIVLCLVGVLASTTYQLGRTLGERSGAAATWRRLEPFVHETREAEIQALAQAYGPSRHSEHVEEWILKDFFKDERDGVFVEVGANHHQRFSNTYYLETVMGWSGVAVEPQIKFASGYRRYRPRTTFVPLFISDVSNQQATLYVTENDLVASGVRNFTESFGEVTATPTTTSTLDDVLDRLSITRIDFLSIDIELGEPQALAGFSIARFRPRLVAIEAHPPVRQQILDYFARHAYVSIGRYWQADDENFWFAPLGRTGNGTPLAVHSD